MEHPYAGEATMRGLLASIRKDRKMPWLRRGMHVEVRGKPGHVTGGNMSCNIQVRFEGEQFSRNCHPHWETKYYARDGTLIADYTREQAS